MSEPRPHFLLVGDEHDVPMIQAILRRLPVEAYGQVLLEVSTPLMVSCLDVPESVTVTWLYRYSGAELFEPIRPRGERAAQALRAWAGEWLPDEQAAAGAVVIWVGCSEAVPVDIAYWDIRTQFPQLHMHHPDFDQVSND